MPGLVESVVTPCRGWHVSGATAAVHPPGLPGCPQADNKSLIAGAAIATVAIAAVAGAGAQGNLEGVVAGSASEDAAPAAAAPPAPGNLVGLREQQTVRHSSALRRGAAANCTAHPGT